VTAKLPERDGGFEYHVRSVGETHERLAHEFELQAMTGTEAEPTKPKGKPRP
jgi:hypothetical protein